ncbi:hypothetical protein SERLA73DRAFT_175681 [Serpula lacrymans var. lacrymans S7.3]|uniref:Aldehyde dehydrogenase n=2 Tax=Serpula lacrymans var. lacrymans TaxID=341189 RepID=F8PL64_SERL3|nr:uncharacterized protein SERLADRAFT_458233 [Serpula lacrymans var. lacrymans S7.9]EGO03972.1 hypothetical protein SERLA73DRAFT_175681 [Serpula lacrymans var. lacrymans S7.3]EGO29891.1 hypothetical protein SERLADRAFT_458233 [Serpula lacrymans var. lacrymans S7.9]
MEGSKLVYTPLDEIDEIYTSLRQGFSSGKLKSVAYRKIQILQVAYLLQDNIQRFKDALAADLGRPSLESSFLELNAVLGDTKVVYDRVDKWAKPERPPFSLNFAAMRPVIRKEPKGVVLIISPFNYPIFLTIGPLVGAIAAGNTVVIKPSELSPAVSGLFAELVPKYLDPDVARVVNGAIPETTKLLEYPWDHILYTGNGRVAKIVCAAAAKHLSPVTLELGGKSPVIIDPGCDLKTAAKRILWGKVVNAGQTCVAPDYILVPRHFQDKLVDALKEVHDEFYPKGSSVSPDFSRIVSTSHFNRIKRLLDSTQGTVAIGGDTDESKKFIAPTVVKDVQEGDALMSEELFGPVLPIVPVDSVDDAIAYVNRHDHPLALYVFSQDAAFKAKVFDNTQSGAAIANEVVIYIGADGLPFGGIGPSGSGYHTGKYSFDLFTHFRSSMDSPSWVDVFLGNRFPPYTAKKEGILRKALVPSFPARPTKASIAAVAASASISRSSLVNGTNGSIKRWGNWFLFVFGLALASAVLTKGTAAPTWFVGWIKNYFGVRFSR